MSVGECLLCLGCTQWAWKRCIYIGSDDSKTWPYATPHEIEPIPRICRAILAVYKDDPTYLSSMDPTCIVKSVTYKQTQGYAPPYIIYIDHTSREIILAIRGLNLAKESDYKVLLNNRLGMQMLDGGYVHHGLLKSAVWMLNRESDTIRDLWREYGSSYKMVFAGHSLGSGVAALLAIVAVNYLDKIGGIPRSSVRCYAVAPARCMSLNLAVKYADVIYSVVLQDDFLPRTQTPLEDIFKSLFWCYCFTALDSLPFLLFFICMKDTFISKGRKLRDPRKLYAPGRMYHIIERKSCRCGRYPPEVRTAIPVEGRFERIVLSCNATSDHAIIWIAKEAQKALDMMKESDEATTTPPAEQTMVRRETLEKEHKDALERAISLNVPHAVLPTQETAEDGKTATSHDQPEGSTQSELKCSGSTNWDELVEKLFN